MSMYPYRVYKASARCEEFMPQLRMRTVEWSVLFSMNGDRSLHEISRHLDLSGEEINQITGLLLSHGLIEEEAISFDQYVRITGKGPDAQKTVSVEEYLEQGKQENVAPIPVVAPVPPASAVSRIGVSLPPLPGTLSASAGTSSPAQKPVLLLRALIDFIVAQAPSSTEGQLAVYRVFLRVPPELLKRNGIVSLSLVEDQSTVEDSELQAALARAVQQTLKLSLPSSVFA